MIRKLLNQSVSNVNQGGFMTKKVLIILAEGFEEIEAATPIDVLRRAGAEVTLAGLDALEISGAHGLIFHADTELNTKSGEDYDAIVLPGGGKGAKNLASSPEVTSLIKDFNEKNKLIAAICASPAVVLAPAGILDGKRATCYPGMQDAFANETAFSEDPVVSDGNIITSRGPGTAAAFSFALLEKMGLENEAAKIRASMMYD